MRVARRGRNAQGPARIAFCLKSRHTSRDGNGHTSCWLKRQGGITTHAFAAWRGHLQREDRAEDVDRSTWLKAQRRLSEAQADTVYAPIYDDTWGTIAPTHQWMRWRWCVRKTGPSS
jgi:hypothetical protein